MADGAVSGSDGMDVVLPAMDDRGAYVAVRSRPDSDKAGAPDSMPLPSSCCESWRDTEFSNAERGRSRSSETYGLTVV